uniref:Formin binding protein 1a n=1 Tax=Amphilophus citrinellus TaxID=61819 RepID=A0A3Q0RMD9_AMPCI
MSCNWGTELWDQFDNLEKHTSWGIDFLERYTKFVKERADIELSYAKQIRSLSKKYHPKRNREDESRYSWCLAFAATLQQLNELSVQREDLAENMNTQIVCELTRYTQELKAERKSHFQDGRRAQQHIESSWKQLESSKRRFERDCKEAERAQHVSDRIDLDNKTDGEKARQTAQQKQQAAEESRKDYVTSLNQFNQDQHQHYHTLVPVIYQRIQDMEERRIERIGEAMRSLAEADRKVLPVVSRCLDAMMDAAESIQPRKDTLQVVEVYKSGFDPPGDVEFEDYSATMRRSISESNIPGGITWLYSCPSLPLSVADPPILPPAASTPTPNLTFPWGSHNVCWCLMNVLMLQGSSPADCSHLPPEQRRKKLQSRINSINQEIQREREQRDALLKMREVYERSPQMGDASSLEPRLEEVKQNLQRLEEELRKNQVWLSEADSRLSDHSTRRQSGGYVFRSSSLLTSLCLHLSFLSPDGSYTEDHSAELHFKSRSSEFDDDFDDEEPLPSIGTCKSLYPFQGQNEGTLSMVEGELLSVVEEDKGDGWTRVRRNLEEEGYVPTSYIKVFLDSSAKGAMTYI